MIDPGFLSALGHPPLRLSVIVPVRDGASTLGRCLAALQASDLPRELWELLVIDDGSHDDSAVLAAQYADVVVRLGGAGRGPAYARNRGAELARGEYLVFVDADVCVERDVLRRLAAVLDEDESVAAVVGSYDDRPAAPDFVSQYRNLLRHWLHRNIAGDVGSFWGGCGAIRRALFLRVGQYDEWRFRGPQIEDIELGHRLRAAGQRITLRPEIRATHLKRWTLRSLLQQDAWARSLLVARLFGLRRTVLRARLVTLATRWTRVESLVCAAAALSIVAVVGGLVSAAAAAAAALTAAIVLDGPLYVFLMRRRGLAFALAAVPLHTLRALITGIAFGCGWTLRHAVGEPRPDPVTEAFAEVGLETWPPLPARR